MVPLAVLTGSAGVGAPRAGEGAGCGVERAVEGERAEGEAFVPEAACVVAGAVALGGGGPVDVVEPVAQPARTAHQPARTAHKPAAHRRWSAARRFGESFTATP
jgi:hypothetical protein